MEQVKLNSVKVELVQSYLRQCRMLGMLDGSKGLKDSPEIQELELKVEQSIPWLKKQIRREYEATRDEAAEIFIG